MDTTDPYFAVRAVLGKFPTDENVKVCSLHLQQFANVTYIKFCNSLTLW